MVNDLMIPVYHPPSGDAAIVKATVGGATLSGLIETTHKNQHPEGLMRPIVTIQSIALQVTAITSAATGVAPQAGATDVVVTLSDQPLTRRRFTPPAEKIPPGA